MTIKHAEFETGTLDFSAITNTFQTVLTILGDVDAVQVLNSVNDDLVVKFSDSTQITLPGGKDFLFDGRSNRKRIKAGTFQVKYNSLAPTLGRITFVTIK